MRVPLEKSLSDDLGVTECQPILDPKKPNPKLYIVISSLGLAATSANSSVEESSTQRTADLTDS